MSRPDDDTTEQAATPEQAAQARAAEIHAEVAQTDARRAEEETAKAQEEAEAAAKEQEERAQDAAQAKARSERLEAEAQRARETAGVGLSGAAVTGPGVGSETDPSAAAAARAGGSSGGATAAGGGEPELYERPEVQVAAAFAGSFLLAQILKRLVG